MINAGCISFNKVVDDENDMNFDENISYLKRKLLLQGSDVQNGQNGDYDESRDFCCTKKENFN